MIYYTLTPAQKNSHDEFTSSLNVQMTIVLETILKQLHIPSVQGKIHVSTEA